MRPHSFRKCALYAAVPVLLVLGLGSGLMAQGQAPAALPPIGKVVKAEHPGRVIFEQHCAACHGAGPGDDGSPMLPGTATLHRRYQGALPGALELRDDLDGDMLRIFVRNGIGPMPSFRKAELSDAEIDLIAHYLLATAEASAR